jgi:peptide/nickel transport system substrate-binding protein
VIGTKEKGRQMRSSALVLGVLCALVVLGTGGGVEAAPARINELVIAIGGDAVTLDPTLTRETTTDMVVPNIFDALMVRDQNMKPQPHLLESLKNVDDQTWEIKLRPGIRFTNGEPLDYAAVKHTFEVIFDKTHKSVLPTWLGGIVGVEKIDDVTMRIKTRAAMPLMAQNLTMVYPVPPRAHRDRAATGFNRAPIGTGPYKLERWVKDSHISLVANDAYWGGKPPFPRVTFKVIPEDATRVSSFLTGEAHVVQNVAIPELDRVRQVGQVQVIASGRIMALQLNALPGGPHKEFLDKRVRQAVAYAIDVDSISRELYKGTAPRIATFLHPKYFGHDASFKPYPHDPNKAKQLLAAAGYPNGFSLGINAAVGMRPMDKETVEAVAGQLTKVGIRTRLVPYEYAPYIAAWRNKKLEGAAQMMGILSQTWDADGAFFLRFARNQPMSYFSTDRLDRLVNEGRTTIDPAKRLAIYKETLGILHDEMPVVPLVALPSIWGLAKNLEWQARADELIHIMKIRVKSP